MLVLELENISRKFSNQDWNLKAPWTLGLELITNFRTKIYFKIMIFSNATLWPDSMIIIIVACEFIIRNACINIFSLVINNKITNNDSSVTFRFYLNNWPRFYIRKRPLGRPKCQIEVLSQNSLVCSGSQNVRSRSLTPFDLKLSIRWNTCLSIINQVLP